MMVSIHAGANRVYVEGLVNEVDCSALAEQNVHAVQWRGDHGEIEFKSIYLAAEKREHRDPNQPIDNFTPYLGYVDKWLAQEEIKQREITRQRLEREKHEANIRKNEDAMRAVFTRVGTWRRGMATVGD